MRLDFSFSGGSGLVWLADADLVETDPAGLAQEPPGTDVLMVEFPEDLVANIRLVVGDLEDEEEDSWVGSRAGGVRIRSGRALLGNVLSSEFLRDDLEHFRPLERGGRYKEGARFQLDEGGYQARVLSYLPGDPSWIWASFLEPELYGQRPGLDSEPMAGYFARTRPGGQTAPEWLEWEFHEYPRGGRWVDLIVHLQPSPQPMVSDWAARQPERCPMGLPTR